MGSLRCVCHSLKTKGLALLGSVQCANPALILTPESKRTSEICHCPSVILQGRPQTVGILSSCFWMAACYNLWKETCLFVLWLLWVLLLLFSQKNVHSTRFVTYFCEQVLPNLSTLTTPVEGLDIQLEVREHSFFQHQRAVPVSQQKCKWLAEIWFPGGLEVAGQ